MELGTGKEERRTGKACGISFHSTPEELEEILNAHPEMEFVQLQINYADWENQAVQSRACYEVARKHGKPVVIMEPVKGGMLATSRLSLWKKILKDAEPESSAASWRSVSQRIWKRVITVLSGMSSLEQMKDNLSYMKDFEGLTDTEKKVLDKARKALAEIPLIPCTTCNYCAKVCPNDIAFPVFYRYELSDPVWKTEIWRSIRKTGWWQAMEENRRQNVSNVASARKFVRSTLRYVRIWNLVAEKLLG